MVVMLGVSACNLDEKPKLEVKQAPELNTPENTEYNLKALYNSITAEGEELNTLREQLEATIAQTFSWSKGQYGFMSAGNYFVEMSDTKTFDKSIEVGSAYNVFLPVTVKTLNSAALHFQADGVYEPITLYVRVRCDLNDVVGNNYKSIFSDNIVTINVIPYKAEKVYPTIYIVGTPNGWNINGTDCPLISKNSDGVYTGIFTFDNFAKNGTANVMRFYTKLGNWDQNSLGSQVADRSINISTMFTDGVYSGTLYDGKGSFEFTQDGTYTVTVDTNTMTVTIAEGGEDTSNWTYLYVIGTPNGWNINGDKVKLICKDKSNVYKGTILMNADDSSNKFRFYSGLGNWDENSYGIQVDDNPVDITELFDSNTYTGKLVKGKGSFLIKQNGYYDITVDMPKMNVLIARSAAN